MKKTIFQPATVFFFFVLTTMLSCKKQAISVEQTQSPLKVTIAPTSPGEVVPGPNVIFLFELTVNSNSSSWQVSSTNSPEMKFGVDLTNLYVTVNGNQRATINSYTAGTIVRPSWNYPLSQGNNSIKIYGKIDQNMTTMPATFNVEVLKGGLITNSATNESFELITQGITKMVNIRTGTSPASAVITSSTSPTTVDYFGTDLFVYEYSSTLTEAGWQITPTNSPKWVFNQDLSNVSLTINGVQKVSVSSYTAGTEIQIPSDVVLVNGLNKFKLYVTPSNSNTMFDIRLLKGGYISNSTGKLYEFVTTELAKSVDLKDKRVIVSKDASFGNPSIPRVDTAAWRQWGQLTVSNTGISLARIDKITITLTQEGTNNLNSTSLPKITEVKGLQLVTPDSTYTIIGSVSAVTNFNFSTLVPAGTTKTFPIRGKVLSQASGQIVPTAVVDAKWTQNGQVACLTVPVILQTVTVQ